MGIVLEIDAGDFEKKVKPMREAMKPQQFNNAMAGILRETGRHTKQILKKDLPKKYQIKSKDVASAVYAPRIQTDGALGVGCSIPIRGKRGHIGGTYPAKGGRRGWHINGKYRITAKIVKGQESVLPMQMSGYGGMPPFRNFSAPKLNNVAFTREGKSRLPIRSIEGLAIPQMPLNRSEEDVQKDISEFLEKRMEHRLQALVKNGK